MNIRAKRIERITLEMPLVRSDAPVRLLDLTASALRRSSEAQAAQTRTNSNPQD